MEQKLGRSISMLETGDTRMVWESTEIGNPDRFEFNFGLSLILIPGLLIIVLLIIGMRVPSFYVGMVVIVVLFLPLIGGGVAAVIITKEYQRQVYHEKFVFDLRLSRVTITAWFVDKHGKERSKSDRMLLLDNARVDIVPASDLKNKGDTAFNKRPYKFMHFLVLYLPMTAAEKILHYSVSIEEISKFREIIEKFLGKKS